MSGNTWLSCKPTDRTLNDPVELDYPKVSEPDINNIPEFPGYIALEITNVCNLKCTHCNYRYGVDHYTRDRGFVSLETVEKVFNEIKPYGTTVLMNYDGESLIHREFIDYLKLATKMGIGTYFNTNATLLNRAISEELVSFYKGTIFFSVDGDKEWFEKVRLPAKYEDVIKNIETFIEINEQNGSPITIGISLCNLGQSVEERKKFYEHWINRVNYVSMGEVNDKCGSMISNPMTTLDIKKRPICVVPWQTLGIGHDGDVIPCSIYITRANTTDTVFGNIYNQSIKEIWHGEKFAAFRQMLSSGKVEGTHCETCERWRCQFYFDTIVDESNIKIERNGYWTTFTNFNIGELNFKK